VAGEQIPDASDHLIRYQVVQQNQYPPKRPLKKRHFPSFSLCLPLSLWMQDAYAQEREETIEHDCWVAYPLVMLPDQVGGVRRCRV